VAKEAASEVLLIEGREVRVTHPDKLYFSTQAQISKLDLVRYYLSVAPGALVAYQKRRPPSGRPGYER
jgi:DNA primase